MKNDDVALIRQILDGDEIAFAELVKKYQKQVHVLAWRKIGDFHIAEDITQDTFLKVYQRLHTLKDPNLFSGWLYVITTRLCATWLRRNRIQTQPLEDVEETMIQREAYSQHVADERAKTTSQTQREVVKKLLAKLKESERTVMTLYYLGEMTVEEISKFLGVSAGTIKSRLQRARNRLQKEETMIKEALEHFQLSPNLTENIMQKVSRLKPTPSTSKPLVPWAIAAASAVLIVLLLGIGSQNLVRFQQPYSLDAQAEMTVELVDTPIVLNLDVKPDVRNQLGNSNALGISENEGQKPDEVLFTAAKTDEEEKVSVPKQQWMQSEPVKGSRSYTLHVTSQGELYALGGKNPSIFKLSNDETGWKHVFDIILLKSAWSGDSPITKWNDTLYFIPSHELFASKDDGKTWALVYSWEKEYDAIQFIFTDKVFYLAFDKGIFRSYDLGTTWEEINEGLMGDTRSVVKVQNTLFAGTDNGFYRLEGDTWKRLKFPVEIGRIRSLTSTEEKLYVAAGLRDGLLDPRKVSRGLQRSWWIFRSTDLGNSWDDITPTHAWNTKGWPPFVKLIASGNTLLAMEKGMVRSDDSGDTWQPTQLSESTPTINADIDRSVVVNGNVFYVTSAEGGLHRSLDKGKSWDKVNFERESRVDDLVLFKGKTNGQITPSVLYAKSGDRIINTIDQGESWNVAQLKIPMGVPDKEETPSITHILKYGGVIYAKGGNLLGRGKTRVYRISTVDGISIIPIQGLPIFDSMELGDMLAQGFSDKQLQESAFGATEFFEQLAKWDPQQLNIYMQLGFRTGAFAISADTFYMEYNYKLFRSKMGDIEWHDTGLEEYELPLKRAMRDLKLAVSDDTVYVGKRDGHLVVSLDRGNNWVDLTHALPFPVKAFKDIVIVGNTVYVSTDAGVAASDRGNNWGVVTDSETTNLVMEHLTVDGTILYGVTKDTGIYRLENGTWNQIVSEIPERITSLAVDGNTLYVGTQDQGMLHLNLNK